MTAEKLQKLKQQQKEALKNGDFATLNKINKIIFEEREKRRQTREQEREQEREKRFSARICSFCEKMLSAENEREL